MLTTLFTILLAIFILGYGGWFLYGFIRYVASGEYETDKRFREMTD